MLRVQQPPEVTTRLPAVKPRLVVEELILCHETGHGLGVRKGDGLRKSFGPILGYGRVGSGMVKNKLPLNHCEHL